jgi:hypothetical protein
VADGVLSITDQAPFSCFYRDDTFRDCLLEVASQVSDGGQERRVSGLYADILKHRFWASVAINREEAIDCLRADDQPIRSKNLRLDRPISEKLNLLSLSRHDNLYLYRAPANVAELVGDTGIVQPHQKGREVRKCASVGVVHARL